jgi:hypothetical protein
VGEGDPGGQYQSGMTRSPAKFHNVPLREPRRRGST